MRLSKLKAFHNLKKATVFMDEKAETREDKEKAIMAIAHEIRNPLTAIKLTNELMQEAFEQHELDGLLMQSYMTIISNNINRIENHLKDVLQYKQREIDLVPVNVCHCIDKALSEAKDRLYLSDITVSNNYNGRQLVYGNEEKLVSAFLNIIINSIEAIRSKKGRIWIAVYKTNNTLRVSFKDNGTGMEPATANKIFDPNFSTKDGIGIGLYSVKETMNLHRASIIADSLPGIGTSISILFNSIPEEEVLAKSRQASGPVTGSL